jgi:hypothetical protein
MEISNLIPVLDDNPSMTKYGDRFLISRIHFLALLAKTVSRVKSQRDYLLLFFFFGYGKPSTY